MGESVETVTRDPVRAGSSNRATVIKHCVRAKWHAASSPPAVADRNGDERSFPRETFRPKASAVRGELPEARDAGKHIGQSAQVPLKLRVGFHGDARAEAPRYQIYERPVIEKAPYRSIAASCRRQVVGPRSDPAPARRLREQNRWRCREEECQANIAPANPNHKPWQIPR
jgi:hypothetical protein